MTISRKLYGILAERLGEDFRDDYSGRGMFGKRCLGFVFSSAYKFYCEMHKIVLDNGEANAFLSGDFTCMQDSMGFDTIFYFPDISVEGI